MRSERELLALVHDKAGRIRRRRRRALGATATLIAIVFAAGITAAVSIDPPADTVVTADQPAPTTTTVPVEETTRPPDDTPPPDGDAPTTTTTAPEAATQPDATDPPVCPPEAIEAEITTDQAAYRPGEPVIILWRITNRSGGDCLPFESSELMVRNDENAGLGWGYATMAGRLPGGEWRWPAGDTLEHEEIWDQRIGGPDGDNSPPGAYTVTITWTARSLDTGERATYTATTTFRITSPSE